MPHISCPRCHRANPGDAVFCWFDGVVLNQSAGEAASSPSQLPHVFVFPAGRQCRTWDDLVEGCQAEWQDARDMLRKGDFGIYLARLGRMDLVRAAKEAQAQADPDIALENFISSLPGRRVHGTGPRLDLNPRRLMLGALHAGEQRQLHITIANKGNGLLQGKVSVSEGDDWLKIVGVDGGRELPVKATRDQEVGLRVESRGLAAGRTYSAKLTVVTNGGVAEAPVRLDLTALPFPKPPFQGASAPRDLAERMRANPKPAGPLLESGEVARWFSANGWSYPVPGVPARGVAAVQQFFECMGLSKPPPLELSQNEVRLQCEAPEAVRGQVTLRTPAKKWVYAQASGDKPWLRVTTPNVSGPQHTTISFEVDSAQLGDGPAHDALLQISANAGQRFQVRVRVEVRRPAGYRPPTRPAPPPLPVVAPPFKDRRAVPSTREAVFTPRPTAPGAGGYVPRLIQAAVVGAVLALLLRLVLFLPADLYARMVARAFGGPPTAVPTAGWDFWRQGPMTEAAGDKPSVIDPGFLRQFVLATWWVGGVAGMLLVWRSGGRWTDVACGGVAGAAAGVAGAATLGCATVLLDGLPRMLLGALGFAAGPSAASLSPWLATLLWLVFVLGCWTLFGAGLGLLLGAIGARGGRLLGTAAAPLAWLLRACGLPHLGSLFSLQ